MLKIAVIGWYGTETIGDRAIFAGLLSVFSDAFQDFEIQLGSIYPFFTERTLIEDKEFYNNCAGNKDVKIDIFDSQNRKELDSAINNCDILVMGGGPLMGFPALFMVEYAFKKARKLKKRTMTLGCGVGPMRKRIYERSLLNIISHSDVTIFRDETSLKEYQRLSGNNIGISAIDPAVFAALIFKQSATDNNQKGDYVAASIREFPEEYKINKGIDSSEINSNIEYYLSEIQKESGKRIELIPMHYFEIGSDDRKFLNKIYFELKNTNITVQNNPLSLLETMKKFHSATACIGMRFHSVVLQTILNGNNMIIDYTDPNNGKIGNFIRQVNAQDFYKGSYVNLQTKIVNNEISFPSTPFLFNHQFFLSQKEVFIKGILSFKL